MPAKSLSPRARWLRRAALAGSIALLAAATPALAQEAGGLTRAVNEIGGDGRPLSLSLQILVLMSQLTVLPSLLLRILVYQQPQRVALRLLPPLLLVGPVRLHVLSKAVGW